MSSASQAPVDRYFDATASYWNDVYDARDLAGRIYRRRMQTAVAWARELATAPGAAALEVGCGSGLMSVELARIGFSVTATDSSSQMVETARTVVAEHGLTDRVTLDQADVHRLPFPDGHFALIAALGVLPWLHDAQAGLRELARVLAPGGVIILTADNRRRLNRLTEPRENAALGPLRSLWQRARHRGQPDQPVAQRHLPGEVDDMLRLAGLAVLRRATVGYGPFTVLDHPVLPNRLGCALDARLERAARTHARLRGAGWHYVVAGVKRA